MPRLAALLALLIAACGESSSAPPDAFETLCGAPGDEGNELGVGKFCETLNDCSTTADAPLCSVIGDENTHFCTKTCMETDPDTVCGDGAECVCGNGGCGCTPTACL